MPFTAGLGSYQIVWLRDGVELASELSGLKNLEEVVRYARAKVRIGVAGAATEFLVNDETGREICRYQVGN